MNHKLDSSQVRLELRSVHIFADDGRQFGGWIFDERRNFLDEVLNALNLAGYSFTVYRYS